MQKYLTKFTVLSSLQSLDFLAYHYISLIGSPLSLKAAPNFSGLQQALIHRNNTEWCSTETVLGHILFSIFINDLRTCVMSSRISVFALPTPQSSVKVRVCLLNTHINVKTVLIG